MNAVTTEKKGNTTMTANVPSAAKGESVTLSTTVSDGDSVKITTAKATNVEIPVEDVTPGTEAVIVDAKGNEKIVSTSMVTENGVVLTISGTET